MFAQLVWDTMAKPATTLRAIAAERRLLPALGVILVVWVLQVLSELVFSSQPLPAIDGMVVDSSSRQLALLSSPWWRVALLVSIPFGWLVLSGLVYWVGKMFHARGAFTGLLAALGFAQSPGIISIAAVAVFRLLGTPGICLGSVISLGMGIWVIVLQVIAIREGLALTPGRALATWLLSLVVLFVVMVVVTIPLAILAEYTLV